MKGRLLPRRNALLVSCGCSRVVDLSETRKMEESQHYAVSKGALLLADWDPAVFPSKSRIEALIRPACRGGRLR